MQTAQTDRQTDTPDRVSSEDIKFDNGDTTVAELREPSGWIRDQVGDIHRMRRLGDERLIHDEARWN